MTKQSKPAYFNRDLYIAFLQEHIKSTAKKIIETTPGAKELFEMMRELEALRGTVSITATQAVKMKTAVSGKKTSKKYIHWKTRLKMERLAGGPLKQTQGANKRWGTKNRSMVPHISRGQRVTFMYNAIAEIVRKNGHNVELWGRSCDIKTIIKELRRLGVKKPQKGGVRLASYVALYNRDHKTDVRLKMYPDKTEGTTKVWRYTHVGLIGANGQPENVVQK